MVALVDGVPRTLSLRSMIGHYVDHQREVIVRRTKHELSQREARAHVLEGLLIALEHLDEVIALIRAAADRENARAQLIERYGLSLIQAQAILDLRLSQLTALESDQIKREHADTLERIAELRGILGDELRVLAIVKEELLEIRERFGDERRTEIVDAEGEIDIEDLIADQQMVIAMTHSGYIKSLPLDTYRQQHRGGRGVSGMDMKDGDFIEHLFICSTHDYLLFFTNRGKVYRSRVYDLPEASRTARGRALVNILPLREGERVQSVLSTRDYSEGRFLVFATRDGIIKKTEFSAYNTPINADGIIAINIRDDDELVAVRRTTGDDDILMVSRSGQAARFHESQVRSMGRATGGIKGMNVSQRGNRVLAMDVARDDQELLVVTENGYGKRTALADYPRKGRGTMGVKTIALTENKGGLAGALVVREHEELVFVSARRHGAAHARARDQPLRPRRPGRAPDEPQRRRHRQRRRARRRARRATSTKPTAWRRPRRRPTAQGRRSRTRRCPTRTRRPPTRRRRRGPCRRRGPAGSRRRRLLRRVAPPLWTVGRSGAAADWSPSSRFDTLLAPEKGGGPHLADSTCGTLEVAGR